ncbi:hypothetical protein [Streptomyces alboflavus]|uniref:hypothetical protein n=1 Tax=Streptomyces alboflavus TaxID=67267 RepID=UPI0036CEE759
MVGGVQGEDRRGGDGAPDELAGGQCRVVGLVARRVRHGLSAHVRDDASHVGVRQVQWLGPPCVVDQPVIVLDDLPDVGGVLVHPLAHERHGRGEFEDATVDVDHAHLEPERVLRQGHGKEGELVVGVAAGRGQVRDRLRRQQVRCDQGEQPHAGEGEEPAQPLLVVVVRRRAVGPDRLADHDEEPLVEIGRVVGAGVVELPLRDLDEVGEVTEGEEPPPVHDAYVVVAAHGGAVPPLGDVEVRGRPFPHAEGVEPAAEGREDQVVDLHRRGREAARQVGVGAEMHHGGAVPAGQRHRELARAVQRAWVGGVEAGVARPHRTGVARRHPGVPQLDAAVGVGQFGGVRPGRRPGRGQEQPVGEFDAGTGVGGVGQGVLGAGAEGGCSGGSLGGLRRGGGAAEARGDGAVGAVTRGEFRHGPGQAQRLEDVVGPTGHGLAQPRGDGGFPGRVHDPQGQRAHGGEQPGFRIRDDVLGADGEDEDAAAADAGGDGQRLVRLAATAAFGCVGCGRGSRRLRFRDALAHFEEGLLGDVLRAERDDEVGRLGGVLADQAAGPDEGAVQAEPLEEEVKVEQVGGAQEPEGLG